MVQTRSFRGILSIDLGVYCKIKGFTYLAWGKNIVWAAWDPSHACVCPCSPTTRCTRGRSVWCLKPDINSLSQIPRGRWAWRHKSKYFRSQYLLASTPTDHPPLDLSQHHQPAICHKVIIELLIGKQLTPFLSVFFLPTFLSSPPAFNLNRKRKRIRGGGSLQINSAVGQNSFFPPFFLSF